MFTDRIVRMIRFRLFYGRLAIRRVSLSLSLGPGAALGVQQACSPNSVSLRLFFKNELPQQAGGVSFPPGLVFEAVR